MRTVDGLAGHRVLGEQRVLLAARDKDALVAVGLHHHLRAAALAAAPTAAPPPAATAAAPPAAASSSSSRSDLRRSDSVYSVHTKKEPKPTMWPPSQSGAKFSTHAST